MTLRINEETISALIIGWDVVARLGLRALLQVSGQVTIVGEAEGGGDAIGHARLLGPDVMLVHTRASGSDLLSELRELVRHAPVLVLADDESPAAIERVLATGVTSFLINGQYGPDELVAVVVATANGQPRLSPAAVRVLIRRVRAVRGHREGARSPRLSRRETEIVDHLVRGRTNAEIARLLGISEKTVKNHVNHVYAKLDTRNRAETVALWLGPDRPAVAG
jgi:DNA-binding NarL/FixJ family response regulator